MRHLAVRPNPTIWLFICRNHDNKHPVRLEEGPAKIEFGNEFIEYLLIHDARVERTFNEEGVGGSHALIPTINSFHMEDYPKDATVLGFLGTRMLQVPGAMMKIYRPCMACRAKGIRS